MNYVQFVNILYSFLLLSHNYIKIPAQIFGLCCIYIVVAYISDYVTSCLYFHINCVYTE